MVQAQRGIRPVVVASSVLALAWLSSGCSDDGAKTVDVKLGEFTVQPSTDEAKAGEVKFEAENIGGTTHEFVVVRAADAASLPTKPDGSVDEDQIDESDRIGEIEDIEAKAKASATFDLDPGDYVLFCNVVQEGDPPVVHFERGMHAQFTVTD
jgi:uncharacterized cupredoxin-like copper-binding protein